MLLPSKSSRLTSENYQHVPMKLNILGTIKTPQAGTNRMLTLYDYLPSQNAYKIRLLLNQLDGSFRSKYISIFEGEGTTEAYKSISPTGTVPAIKLENGITIAESNAILIYLSEGTQYLPDSSTTLAKVFQWLFFEGEAIQSGIATLRHWILTGKDKNRSQELLANKRELSIKSLEIMNKHLMQNEFFSGGYYSVADISLFAYVHLAGEANLPLDNYQNIIQWIERVRSQDRFLGETFLYSIDPYSVREL